MVIMKMFISSLIRSMEPFRDAAAGAILNLGHSPIRADDFGASTQSPQQACLAEVRESDVMILILGAEYGHTQVSGLSATHEEYREARLSKPVLVFVQDGMEPEAQQADFIREVRAWEAGHFTAGFQDAADLRDKVMRAIYEYALASESLPLDEAQLVDRARSLIPSPSSSGSNLAVAVAYGPTRSVLRPAELDDETLRSFLMAEALIGAGSVLSPSYGTEASIKGDAIQLTQERGPGFISLHEIGDLLVVQPAVEDTSWRTGIAAVIEEDVAERITNALRFSGRVLNEIDSSERLSHVAVAVALSGVGYMPWRTRNEQERSPNSASVGFRTGEPSPVLLSPPVRKRSALLQQSEELARDFTVRLRREMSQ